MKKITLFTIILGLGMSGSLEASPISYKPQNSTSEISTKTAEWRKKRKRNRPRKGFMWGLFKKRNACDCPKH
ncbi:MAG: hypothetical protein ACK4GN_10640 [Runella sp.]